MYLKDRPTELEAVVCDLNERSVTLLLPLWGLEARVFLDRCGWAGAFDERSRTLTLRPATGDPAGGGAGGTPARARRYLGGYESNRERRQVGERDALDEGRGGVRETESAMQAQ